MTEIRSDINRRMDSAKLWMKANDETAITGHAHNDEEDTNDAMSPACRLQDPQNGTIQPATFDKSEKIRNLSLQRVQPNDNGDNTSDKPSMSRCQPQPNVDIVLSLKDPVYRSVLTYFYQLLGEKSNNNNEDARVREMATEALLVFKTTNNHEEKARFFKPASRNAKNGKFVEVDEMAALKSEDFLLPSVSRCNVFYSK